jgi:bacteriocin-like protein
MTQSKRPNTDKSPKSPPETDRGVPSRKPGKTELTDKELTKVSGGITDSRTGGKT